MKEAEAPSRRMYTLINEDGTVGYIPEEQLTRQEKISICASNKKILNIPSKEVLERFKNQNLMDFVLKELSKDHLGDDNLKMTTFLCCVSGLLKNPLLRKSIAVKANSSEGKDNQFKACLKHMPDESYIFLTSATQATLEDDIKNKRILVFSELNANRENGANRFLVEVIKQKTEGGTSAIKKDIRKGMKEARHEVGEQATVLYGTTETQVDEELGTRFIEGNIKSNAYKIRKVNENTLKNFSDMNYILNESKSQSDSWLKQGLSYFFNKPIQFDILIPYSKYLTEQINGQDIFDNNSPRSQRDLKRVLALTCAVTYLHQEQRKIVKKDDRLILISQPFDLLTVLKYSAEFFNQSYLGVDARLTTLLNLFNEYVTEWVARDDLQEKLGISRNTIKSYCQTLADEGCLKGIKGSELNFEKQVKIYDGNKIYYQRCQKGVKKALIRCQLSELKDFLSQKTKFDLTPFETVNNLSLIDDKQASIENKKVSKKRCQNETQTDNEGLKEHQCAKIDTFELTPFEKFVDLLCRNTSEPSESSTCSEPSEPSECLKKGDAEDTEDTEAPNRGSFKSNYPLFNPREVPQ